MPHDPPKPIAIVPANPEHQAIILWRGEPNEPFAFIQDTFVTAWKLFPDGSCQPLFHEHTDDTIAILLKCPDGKLTSATGMWGTYDNLKDFKAHVVKTWG